MEEDYVENILKKIINTDDISWTPHEKIPLIINEIDQIKSDVKTFLVNSDHDVAAISVEGTELFSESKALVDEMEALKKEIEEETMGEIRKSIENHDQIAVELLSVNFTLNILADVIQCGKYVMNFEEGREAQSFSRAIEGVNDLLQLIEKPADGFEQLDIYENTKTTAQIIFDNLIKDLCQKWSSMVTCIKDPDDSHNYRNIYLNIKLDNSSNSIDIVNALHKCKKLVEKITEFVEILKKEVILPILKHDCTVKISPDEGFNVKINNYKENKTPYYRDSISNIIALFEYVHDKFNIRYFNDITVMDTLGDLICEDFCDIMINECLVKTVPSTIYSLNTYDTVTGEIQKFESSLTSLKVLPKRKKLTLLKYMDDIDVLFANQSSQYFLATARSIMLKDLSVTMSIGLEEVPESFSSETFSGDKHTEEALEMFGKTIPKSLYYFPRCMISRTAQELLDWIYIIMEQAGQCPDIVCKKLYYTVRLIFELYDAVVPYSHENYLQTIPQYVALFHNNCMFLAHNLQTLGDKWLFLMEDREIDHAVGFVDLVQKLRDLGYKHLTMHMQQQRKQILDNIRSSDLNCIVVKDVLGENAEAAVRQCLRQLQILKNVWIGVFPSNVFTRLMATLVNMFVEELIHRVCTVEDISMEMATQLTEMYKLVVQKSPLLFKNSSDVEKYVKSWVKLQELIFVLGGSLKDIENHWNEGNGPLAVHFNVEELRSLIKALFQNTQFRANLLSKIK